MAYDLKLYMKQDTSRWHAGQKVVVLLDKEEEYTLTDIPIAIIQAIRTKIDTGNYDAPEVLGYHFWVCCTITEKLHHSDCYIFCSFSFFH